jgi:CheY-like chemotaxis protein
MRQTILVVDDQPGTRRLVRNILERDGYAVVEAEDGPSACRAMHQRDDMVSLALIDVDLPGAKGREVAEHLQMLAPLRVLFMSGHRFDELIAGGQLAPDAPLLAKPFKVAELLRAVGNGLP